MAPANPTSGAPTGCFKCGRPGHWSRDCPSFASSSDPAATLPPSQQHNAAASGGNWKPSSNPASSSTWKTGKAPPKPVTAKPTLPRKRPKLSPDLLLSNEGLGYVLEHFPRMVKIQGPGHEVDDLKSLLEAYIHWHSRILPYFSFNQFVEKVEKVGSTKRVRTCVNDLKDKVAMGDEPKLALKEKNPDGVEDDEDLSFDHDLPTKGSNSETWEEPRDDALPADINEEMFDEFYKQAVEEGSDLVPHSTPQTVGLSEPVATNDSVVDSSKLASRCINEEQKIRMEANRLRALERAKARMAAAMAT